jgi:hypothetical protein
MAAGGKATSRKRLRSFNASFRKCSRSCNGTYRPRLKATAWIDEFRHPLDPQAMKLCRLLAQKEHLDRYPDIPVLVNEELAKYFPDDEGVMALPGLNHAEVHQVTESSLQAGRRSSRSSDPPLLPHDAGRAQCDRHCENAH